MNIFYLNIYLFENLFKEILILYISEVWILPSNIVAVVKTIEPLTNSQKVLSHVTGAEKKK